jgi:hypothetical protein
MAQYGHTLWVTSAPRRRDCVAAVRGLNGSRLLMVPLPAAPSPVPGSPQHQNL